MIVGKVTISQMTIEQMTGHHLLNAIWSKAIIYFMFTF